MFKIFKTYYRFLWRYKWRFLLFIFSLICLTISENILPYFYKIFIDAISQANQQFLLRILFIYIGVRFLTVVFEALTRWISDRVVFPAARDARISIFKRIQDLDFAFHLSKSTGSLISVMKRGDNAFWSFHDIIHLHLIRILLGLLIVLAFFANVNWSIAAIMLASFGVNLGLARSLIKKNMQARQAFNRQEDKISAIIVDNLINFETVKLFARENWELKKLKHELSIWLKRLWQYGNTFRKIDITIGTSGNVGLFFILLLGLNQVAKLKITPGEYIMILGFVGGFYYRFFEMIYELRSLAKHYVDIKKYFAILENQILVKDPSRAIIKKNIKGELEFKNIGFSYPERKEDAIKNINLEIRQGQSIALVGHSGAGKTTIIKLLMRFYDPTQGKILLDNVDIKQFTKSQLRSFMGVVPQEPILFNHTIGYNISYAVDRTSQKQIEAAAKIANLDNFIKSLPEKYETMVGERGIKLSGGQKQRLAIARMLLSNPKIIIFDEATSQLDSQSEKQIQEAFWKTAKNKTTLIIAHRLSTVVRADKIIVMENGQIVEIGSHRQLLSKKTSLYRHFWQLQSQGELI